MFTIIYLDNDLGMRGYLVRGLDCLLYQGLGGDDPGHEAVLGGLLGSDRHSGQVHLHGSENIEYLPVTTHAIF